MYKLLPSVQRGRGLLLLLHPDVSATSGVGFFRRLTLVLLFGDVCLRGRRNVRVKKKIHRVLSAPKTIIYRIQNRHSIPEN